MLFAVVWMLSQALMPAVVGRAIDRGVAARDGDALLAWSAALLGLGALQAMAGVFRHRLSVFVWLGTAYRTVQVVTRQASRLGATLPRRMSAGEVVSVGVSDVAHLGDAVDILGRGTGAVVGIVVVAGMLLGTSPRLGLVVLIGVPVILAAAAPLLRPLQAREERHRELVGELNSRATDLVAGLRVLRGVGGEELFAGRYRDDSQRVRRAGVDVARAESMLSGAEILLPGLLVALVTWLGARYAAAGTISVGQLVAFYGYAVFLIQPLKTLGEAAGKLTKGRVAAGRVVRLLALEPELPDTGTVRPAGPAELVDTASGFVARPGVFTAIAASDPRDAQAIADRLGRYAGGDVTYGGVPLRDVAGLRERVLVAVNEDRLFAGPLWEGLRPARGGGDLAMAVEAACAADVVAAAGPDARVAEAGREFSGGQQQRLRLARALAADPEVLVLVEPTSAVDAHTESRIAARLGEARAGRTTVVCTTSPLVLDRADHVVYVEHGRVAAEGAHRDLLGSAPRYAACVTRGM
ncbi:putative multidrug resistance ABC transporter ATP-binding/permease protein YheI [Actinomadura sp. RB68]|uniref:Putative multidrug resistance ABC transporter ATP-binding/permease protein YheI n=1 Tax=Actinomadura macrotermitis TaxID=2585200 RepID=A0A7K0BRK2_9ACTN|nr:putative multidrug resistance ABC transporter ATP-binding/permease protein YheI [Actinomadura macrotermitis]